MVHRGNFVAHSLIPFITLVSARPDNLRGRTPPIPNTCACLPVPDGSTSTLISTVTTTATATATVTRTLPETSQNPAPVTTETITVDQTLTLTVTVSPPGSLVTETVYVSKESTADQVTVTFTKTVSEGPDGSATTKTNSIGGGSETSPPNHDSETTKTARGSPSATRSGPGGHGKPTHPSKPPHGGNDHDKSKPGPKPTTTPKSSISFTATSDILPNTSLCSVSVAFVTIYNTITATVYEDQGSSVQGSTAGPMHKPRAPTVAAAML